MPDPTLAQPRRLASLDEFRGGPADRAADRAKTITDVREFIECRKNADGGLTLRPVELDQLLLMLHV